MKKIILYFYHLIVVFGFLFEIPIAGSLTTRRVSVLIALITIVIRQRQVKSLLKIIDIKRLYTALGLLVGCMFLVFLTTSVVPRIDSSSYMEPWHLLNLILYVLVFAIYSVVEFNTVKRFTITYASAFLIQVPIVLYSVINEAFRLFLYSSFYFGDDRFDRSIELGTRIMGISMYGSQGSIMCSTVIALLTFVALRKEISNTLYFILSVLIIAMTLFIGRTGVLIEGAFMIFFLWNTGKEHFISNVIVLSMAGFGLFLIVGHVLSSIDPVTGEKLTSWMTAAFNPEEREGTASVINRAVPDFSLEFILGTGVRGGTTPGGSYVDSDSGYVINYSALGIVGSLMYYIANLKLFKLAYYKNRKKIYRRFLLICIVMAFLIEYKEPFMMKYIFSYMLVTIGLFSVYDNPEYYCKEGL